MTRYLMTKIPNILQSYNLMMDLILLYDFIQRYFSDYDADDDENSRLNANLCKSVSIGTARRFIPTSGGANFQKNIQCLP